MNAKNESMLLSWVEKSLTSAWTFLVGALSSAITYFLPIKDIVNLMVLFFILDVAFGYWAAYSLRQEKFQVSKIWNSTIPRMILSIILIMLAFMWENIFYGMAGNSYRIIGGFISGILLVSIAQNGYHITRWEIFDRIASLFKNKDKLR